MTSPLKARLMRDIALNGPIPVDLYGTLCLFDPKDGYYTNNVSFQREGDFITAPRLSPVFGEAVAVWIARLIEGLGLKAHDEVMIVEIGPGDGTLSLDIARTMPALGYKRLQFGYIEASPTVGEKLKNRLFGHVHFHTLDDIPAEIPLILIANEVLDCFISKSYISFDGKVFERHIGQDDKGLVFGFAPALDMVLPKHVPDGVIYESPNPVLHYLNDIIALFKCRQGGAVFFDYGPQHPQAGDSLQAIRSHKKADVLENPGLDDLTQQVDFPSLCQILAREKTLSYCLASQSDFLLAHNAYERMLDLKKAHPHLSDRFERQWQRLSATDQMGSLFKALCLWTNP